jgi:PqqD family protein of HPr-rel-A system
MTGPDTPSFAYRAEHRDDIIVETLDMITLVYQKRSGITHLVAEPMPQILAILADNVLTLHALCEKMALQFDLDAQAPETQNAIAARLSELENLGLVERVQQ